VQNLKTDPSVRAPAKCAQIRRLGRSRRAGAGPEGPHPYPSRGRFPRISAFRESSLRVSVRTPDQVAQPITTAAEAQPVATAAGRAPAVFESTDPTARPGQAGPPGLSGDSATPRPRTGSRPTGPGHRPGRSSAAHPPDPRPGRRPGSARTWTRTGGPT
jgi:hypothetical protein